MTESPDKCEQQLPPLTEDEKHRAFEWLRNTALSTRPEARHAYVALREWSNLKSAASAGGVVAETPVCGPNNEPASGYCAINGCAVMSGDAKLSAPSSAGPIPRYSIESNGPGFGGFTVKKDPAGLWVRFADVAPRPDAGLQATERSERRSDGGSQSAERFALTPTGNPLTEEQIEEWRRELTKHAECGMWFPAGSHVLCDMAKAALRAKSSVALTADRADLYATAEKLVRDAGRKYPCLDEDEYLAQLRAALSLLSHASPTSDEAKDAARGRWMLRNCTWYRGHELGDFIVVYVPRGTDLSSIASREDAIDKAMSTKSARGESRE